MSAPLLAVEHLCQHFAIRGGTIFGRAAGHVRAVDDVTFEIAEGETLGLVGESGCGKTTLARAVMRLLDPASGTIRYRGRDVARAGRRELAPVRREMQMVFQDPFGSLNPRRTIGRSVSLPLRMLGDGGASTAAGDLLERVGLAGELASRYPHELSGGQRQRVGIARALATEPRLVVLDEPVSALDVSIQAQIVNLLGDLQEQMGLSYLFVAHDLSVVSHVSDRVAVMYLGKLMEVAPAADIADRPIHPYTEALLAAVPIPDPRESRGRERIVVSGEPPDPADPPPGCVFHTRCPHATGVCRTEEPPLTEYGDGHVAACHHPRNVTAGDIAASSRSQASPLSAGDRVPSAARQLFG